MNYEISTNSPPCCCGLTTNNPLFSEIRNPVKPHFPSYCHRIKPLQCNINHRLITIHYTLYLNPPLTYPKNFKNRLI